MRNRLVSLCVASALPVLASGCVAGTVDPGDPVDYALACGAVSKSPAVALPSGASSEAAGSWHGVTLPTERAASADRPSLSGPLIVGDVVHGLADPSGGVHGSYVPVAVDPSTPPRPIFAGAMQRTIYLNRDGAVLTAGTDDASRNVSSVLGNGPAMATIPPAKFSDSDWLKVVSCVADEFWRFNVQMVTDRPKTPGYMMAMIGGAASDLGQPPGVGGIAPIDKMSCRVIESAIVYAFSEAVMNNPIVTCEIAAQEIGHAFSLDHELLASDPMTYLSYTGHKTFQDADAECGESTPRPCSCMRDKQNSVKILADKAGLFADPAGPDVTIKTPDNGAQLSAGDLDIRIHAASARGIANVVLHYQDATHFITARCGTNSVECDHNGDDYTFTIKDANGLANIWGEASDKLGNTNVTHTILVGVGAVSVPSGALRIVVDVDLSSLRARGPAVVAARVTSGAGTVSDVGLSWTDRRELTVRSPMCPMGKDTWIHAEQVARVAGERNLVVDASDSAGNHATSARYTIVADF